MSSLLGNVLTVGGATLASRVLGFVRDALTAAVLGGGPVADAFVVAFRLPNLFRRLFAEGAFAAAFVPLLIETREESGASAAARFAGAALAALALLVVVVSIPAMIFAPALVRLLAPGFVDDPAKFDLTVTLARICFPYLACISIVALMAGVLAAERRFLAAAAAPILLNTILIATLGTLLVFGFGHARAPVGHAGADAGFALSLAVALAGLAQVILLIVATARVGLLPIPRFDRSDGRLARLAARAGPGLVSGGLVELNVVVGTVIASADPGAVSWLYYADRLYQLPLGVVGIAMGQVLLPELSSVLAGRDRDRVHDVQNRALEFALALALPAALALWLLADPIVVVLFRRGAFTLADAHQAARALEVLALGLPAFVAAKVFAPGFFARGDTRTPMWIGALAVGLNIALALALRPTLGWIAVALATTVAGWFGALAMAAELLRRGHWCLDGQLLRRLPRLALAALAMAAVVAFGGRGLAAVLASGAAPWVAIAALAALVIVGVALFAGLVLALKGVDARALRARPRDPAAALDACSPPADGA